MICKIKRFCAFSSQDQFFFIEAWITLGYARAAVLLFTFKRLTSSLHQSFDSGNGERPCDQQLQVADRIGRMITLASRYTPWESSCLHQVLTVRIMLVRRRIPGIFFLGAMQRQDSQDEKKLEAHAWSQCGKSILTGGKGHESFIVLSGFRWGE